MITVLIADDQAVIRDILRFLLERTGDIEIIGMASNGSEAVAQDALYFPNVVVMDVSMPIMGGIEAAKQILANRPEARIVMVSMFDTPNYIGRCVQAGALGYVVKDSAGHDLVPAVRSVHQDIRYFSKQIAEIAERFLPDTGKTDLLPDVSTS